MDIVYGTGRYTEFLRNYCPRYLSFEGADFQHFLRSKDGISVSLPIPRKFTAASLSNHVPHVVGTCAEEEVVGVDARLDIAGVADLQMTWNIAVMSHPRPSMSMLVASVEFQISVSVPGQSSEPNPTAALGNGHRVVFDPFFERTMHRFRSHFATPLRLSIFALQNCDRSFSSVALSSKSLRAFTEFSENHHVRSASALTALRMRSRALSR